MIDCGNCWLDTTFHGCKLTTEECEKFCEIYGFYKRMHTRPFEDIEKYYQTLEETTKC